MSDVAEVESTAVGLDRYRQLPVIDQIDKRMLALIKAQVAPGTTDAELAYGLEIVARYDLDLFAKEAWIAKSKGGQLLIMAGRDGLRKIAQRNGLHVDGDVVRENDDLTICRTPDGNRTIAHSYTSPKERGTIIGAWAEVREGGPTGRPMGYFYAPLDEYRPAKVSEYSPWSKQVGVMILAAAERQAIRQATPLGGLLGQGEDETISENERQELTAGDGDGSAQGLDLGADVDAVIERATTLGHQSYSDRATIEILLGGRSPQVVTDWVAKVRADLDEFEASRIEVADAEVVESDVLIDAEGLPEPGADSETEGQLL